MRLSFSLVLAAVDLACGLQVFPAAHNHGLARSSSVVAASATEEEQASSPAVAELMAGLREEYSSFFQPLRRELYSSDVSFEDPLISISGMDAYKANIDMLGGRNLLGKVCFTDSSLTMHNVEETNTGLRTRWTLQFRFRLLPWAPLARFTGVSDYTLDYQNRIVGQRDWWDSINLQPRGTYAPVPKLTALGDLVAQLSPANTGAQQASDKELPYELLRRAGGKSAYEIRRYPQHVAVQTRYYKRIDGFGTLGAYTNGANDAAEEIKPYVPSLISVPQDERSLAQITDDSLDLKPSENEKVMRWPLAVPALREPTPPQPSDRVGGYASLDFVESRVVAVLGFSDPTTEPIVRGYAAVLSKRLREDGLVPSEGIPEEEFRLAQFDALNSFGARRSEIWIDLKDHPWE